jgi:cyclopropane-fatty-acyl-phospholipid synthase
MKDTLRPTTGYVPERTKTGLLQRRARQLVLSILKKLKRGQLYLLEGEEKICFGQPSEAGDLNATVTVKHPDFYRRILLGGSIGSAEAYMQGLWQTDDLTVLVRILILNQAVLRNIDSRWTRLRSPAHKAFHALRRDTRKGSRANIAAHYDLGNDFYALFLDETLTYSCAYFEADHSSLKEASLAKYDRVCRKLALGPSDHVLEIGTGWGGFALHAAEKYGCRVTTTTISKQQHSLARERIEAAGLGCRITLLFEDYRDLEGRYDKLVSIEMIEAVGHQYLETFFRCCAARLKPDGMMLLQAITITDRAFERQKRSVDFIKRYIFPGSCIPSIGAISRAVAKGTDLKIDHLEDITPHYAKTLRRWRRRFFENIDAIRAMGFSDAFVRMWHYYFCYCEAGFEERYLGDVQLRLVKPECRPGPILPDLKEKSP